MRSSNFAQTVAETRFSYGNLRKRKYENTNVDVRVSKYMSGDKICKVNERSVKDYALSTPSTNICVYIYTILQYQ